MIKILIPIEPLYLVSEPVGLGTQLHLTSHAIFLKLATLFLFQLANAVSNNFPIAADKKREKNDLFTGNNIILWNSS